MMIANKHKKIWKVCEGEGGIGVGVGCILVSGLREYDEKVSVVKRGEKSMELWKKVFVSCVHLDTQTKWPP